MTGSSWVSYGALGSGVGHFITPQSLAVDSHSHIYVADVSNRRVVSISDMTGANWTVLTQSPVINGVSYSLQSPVAVTVDALGKIYIADNEYYQPAVVRVDDMTGKNWTSLYVGAGAPNSIAVDSSGTVFLGGGGVRLVDGMAGVLSSSGTIAPYGTAYVFGVTPLRLASPRPPAMTLSPTALAFAKQNISTASAPQPVTIANFGGSPLKLTSIAPTAGFIDSTTCPVILVAGSSCKVNVSFAPATTGAGNGKLVLMDNSGNLGAEQVVTLSGVGTAPLAYVATKALTFPAQLLNTASAAQSVVLQNTGTGPLTVASVTATAHFSQTNNCSGTVAPGAGCTVMVSFKPVAVGSVTGTLTIAGNAGTQIVTLAGTGTQTTPAVTASPASLLFPAQLLNTKSATQVVTIANKGTTAVANQALTITGDFAKTTTCPASLTAGLSCSVTITFTPTAVGQRTGSLTVTLSTGSVSVALSGTGSSGNLPGVVSASPSSVSFLNYTIGDNPSQDVILTNTSASSVGLSAIALSGDSSMTQQNTCGSTLAPGASCTVTITFVPLVYGTFNSSLTVAEGSGAKDIIPVMGTCVPNS